MVGFVKQKSHCIFVEFPCFGKLMILRILHTVSGCIIVLSLIGKIIVHYYLDRLQEKNISPGSILLMPLHYLLPYRMNVKNEYRKLKHFCNFLLILAAIALFLNIIFGILIYFS